MTGAPAVLSQDIAVESSGWIHLRAEGSPDKRYPLDAAYAQAFTNPVWLLVGDAPIRDRAAAEHALDWIDRLEAMARGTAGWRSETEVARVVARFDEARAAYRRLRSEAAG